MEVYILDSLLRRRDVVDKFESLIWTERWHDVGDFELDLKSTLENRSNFLVGTKIAINNSYRVMTVESAEDSVGSDGKQILTIKGRSLEALLEDRVVKYSLTDLTTEAAWVLTDTPGNVAREMFDHICRPPAALDVEDAIPFIQPGSIFTAGTIPEPSTPIEWEQKPARLFNAIQEVCTLYDLGFRLVRNFDTSQLYFDIYSGNDRTTRQTNLPPVIFAPRLDNIQNTTEFTNVQKSKNVAYVFSEQGYVVVYGENVDPDISGFDRRVLVVNTNVDPDHPDINGMLIQAGDEALRKNRAISLFDGEVNEYNKYTYGVDYDLGDLTEMRNQDGVISYKRVTEQIFVADSSGERSYPTLAMDEFAGTNTWLALTNKSTVWMDYDLSAETWSDM